ncbi:MAG: nuclear transport factor 2 family protein [Actinobacteria bacterium]|nr:nuclear transport factor 2 family protein [Actinomycetota bacterium]
MPHDAPTDAIRTTLARYCQYLDDGRFGDWASLFTEDCEFRVMGRRLVGRDALRGFIEPAQTEDMRGRHLISEPLMEIDGDRARVTTDYAFVGRDLAVQSSGRYHDVLVCGDDGEWRFREREIVFVGGQPVDRSSGD